MIRFELSAQSVRCFEHAAHPLIRRLVELSADLHGGEVRRPSKVRAFSTSRLRWLLCRIGASSFDLCSMPVCSGLICSSAGNDTSRAKTRGIQKSMQESFPC
eukprot:6292429-Amphidinium_carterae.1